MAKKGDIARAQVYEIIQNAFGANYVDTIDKKIYVNGEENGEAIQFAIAITMPKNPVGAASPVKMSTKANSEMSAFEILPIPGEEKTEVSEDEAELVKKLMAEFNL